MTKIKNGTARRILSLSLVILTVFVLVLSLAACSSSEEDKLSPMTKNETQADFVARVVATSENHRIRLASAYRGYDITAEGFNDDEAAADLGPNVAIAKTVLTDLLESVKFDNDADKAVYSDYTATLTESTLADVINSQGFKTSYDLKVENGFPSILLVWIGQFLGFLTSIVGDYYIVSILIFAILVELLMLPMSIKQQKNTIGMAKLRPQIAKIEKKYAGRTDQVTMRKKQEEIMELQQKSGYSPFSGCLPLIIQLIVVGFILYPIIQNPLRYVLDQSTGFSNALLYYASAPKAAGGLGISVETGNVMDLLSTINKENILGLEGFTLIENGKEIIARFSELSIPKFTAFGINLGKTPSFTSILILIPILNVIGQWASMYLTRRWTNTGYNAMGAQDDAQGRFSMRMMDILPLLMTVFILFKVPAMIGVYWFFRSLISLGKQFIMQKVLPVPKYTDEELRELEKMEKERQKAQKAALKAQPKYRSLHYIDEDDYDELPEVKKNSDNTDKPSDLPEIKD